MQMYTIKAGREGLLVRPNGDIDVFIAKKDHNFFAEDIAMDPIRLHNLKQMPPSVSRNDLRNTQFDHASERLANQGYTVFRMKGLHTSYEWGFAVIIKSEDMHLA